MKQCKFCGHNLKSKGLMTKHLSSCVNVTGTREDISYYVLCEWHDKSTIDRLIDQYCNELLCCDDLRKLGYEFLINHLIICGTKRSSSDERKTERYKTKYKNSIIDRYGVDNISKLDAIKLKKNETYTTTFGSFEKYKEYRKSILKIGYTNYINNIDWNVESIRRKELLYDKFGVYNIAQLDVVRSKISNSLKLKYKSMSLDKKRMMTDSARKEVVHRGGFRSKLETRVEGILSELSISFTTNTTLFGYNYDFVINDNIVLEINGDMWHGNPSLYKSGDYVFSGKLLVDDLWEKDKRKSDILIANNYKIIVLWESEIKHSSDKSLKHKIYNQIME